MNDNDDGEMADAHALRAEIDALCQGLPMKVVLAVLGNLMADGIAAAVSDGAHAEEAIKLADTLLRRNVGRRLGSRGASLTRQ